jgi:hypothetical protein
MRLLPSLMAMPAPLPTPAPAEPPALPTRGERPLGVTILAVIDGIAGVLLLLGATFWLALGTAGSFVPGAGPFLAVFGALFSLFALLFGLLFLGVAWGNWQGMGWAWTLGVILAVIGIIFSLPATLVLVGIVPLALNAFLLWYYTQQGVKRWFGKA